MRKILTVLAVSFALSGCAQLGQIVSTATTTITNPVNAVDIYRVKNVYAATLQAAEDWRVFCWAKPYAAILADPVAKPICQHRRPWLRAIQAAQVKASSAVTSATAFVQNYPTLDASTAIAAAWAAVNDFKNAVPAK